MKYRVKNLRWCPPVERAGDVRAIGVNDEGRPKAIVHSFRSQAVLRTPHQARKIAYWLLDWADALEKEVQRGK